VVGPRDGLEAPMAARQGYPETGGGRARIRAADADRDRVADILGTAYTEGRLSRDEYDARLESALSARTYADLDHVVTDLPAAQPAVPGPAALVPVPARTNGLAIASLACGLAQFAFGPLATIPAIVLGHMARSQIRRTGEQGAGLALAGLVLGWGAVILGIILIAVGLAIAAGMHGGMSMHGPAMMGLPPVSVFIRLHAYLCPLQHRTAYFRQRPRPGRAAARGQQVSRPVLEFA
jgi:DUF1707 SHOCT-like domain/Domain of unknown function (DUF4190)